MMFRLIIVLLLASVTWCYTINKEGIAQIDTLEAVTLRADTVQTASLEVEGRVLGFAPDYIRTVTLTNSSIDLGIQLADEIAKSQHALTVGKWMVRLECHMDWFWRQDVSVPARFTLLLYSTCSTLSDIPSGMVNLYEKHYETTQSYAKMRLYDYASVRAVHTYIFFDNCRLYVHSPVVNMQGLGNVVQPPTTYSEGEYRPADTSAFAKFSQSTRSMEGLVFIADVSGISLVGELGV